MLYYDVAENFKNYLAFFDFVEIEALNKDIKANDWWLLPIEQYENAVELLKIIWYLLSYKRKISL